MGVFNPLFATHRLEQVPNDRGGPYLDRVVGFQQSDERDHVRSLGRAGDAHQCPHRH